MSDSRIKHLRDVFDDFGEFRVSESSMALDIIAELEAENAELRKIEDEIDLEQTAQNRMLQWLELVTDEDEPLGVRLEQLRVAGWGITLSISKTENSADQVIRFAELEAENRALRAVNVDAVAILREIADGEVRECGCQPESLNHISLEYEHLRARIRPILELSRDIRSPEQVATYAQLEHVAAEREKLIVRSLTALIPLTVWLKKSNAAISPAIHMVHSAQRALKEAEVLIDEVMAEEMGSSLSALVQED